MFPAAARIEANPNEPADSSISGIKFDALKMKAIKNIQVFEAQLL